MPTPPETKQMLVIDAASQRICVSLFDSKGALATRTAVEDASRALFPAIAALLEAASLGVGDLLSIAFCSGPGSMLGLRTAVMGIRTWQGAGILEGVHLYSYSSLAVGTELAKASGAADFLVVTDARRSSWNALPSAEGDIAIMTNEELEASAKAIFTFKEFPVWTRTAAKIQELSYEPEKVFASAAFPGMLQPNTETELVNLRPSAFAKWIPKARTADQVGK